MNTLMIMDYEREMGVFAHTRIPFAVVAICDPEIPLLWANSACLELLGGGRRGQDVSALIRERFFPCSLSLLHDLAMPAILGGSGWEGELEALDGTGGVRSLHCTVDVLPAGLAADGAAALVGMRDLTAAKAVEKQQRHRDKDDCLNTMAGAIVHHYANIFTVVHGNLHLAWQELPIEVRRCKSEVGVAQCLYQAMRGAERAIGLIGQLRDYLCPENSRREPTDLVAVCQEAVLLHQPSLYKGWIVLAAPNNAMVTVRADRGQLVQVVNALLRNALEATGEETGTVTLRAGLVPVAGCGCQERLPGGSPPEVGEYAYIEVADHGPGIDPAHLERIFDPFFSTKFLGRGLGLAMVKSIVQAHQGWVSVANKPGEGCSLRVHLPLVARDSRE